MKNPSVLFVLSLFLLVGSIFPHPASATDLYGFLSYWDVEDAEEPVGAGFGLSVPLITDHLLLDGRVYFFEETDFGSSDSLELLPIDLGLQLHMFPNLMIDPYILGGVSWIYAEADRADVDSDFGAYLGVGLQFSPLWVVEPFAEVVYRVAELDADRFSQDELDIEGVTANIGIKLSF